MKILQTLVDSLAHKESPISEVQTGAFWTIVTSRFTGMSTTYRDLDLQHTDRPQMVKKAGHLTELTAGELAQYAFSEESVSASIGMASINSLIDIDETQCQELNAFDIAAEKGKGRNIGVVGHFPFVPKLREVANQLWVIEKRLRPGDLPAEDAAKILPQCDVVCLTGTSFINHTIEELLALCSNAFIILTGPTSPMTPLLFDFGIDVICGTKVTDPQLVARYITQGATFRQLKHQGVKLLALAKEKP